MNINKKKIGAVILGSSIITAGALSSMAANNNTNASIEPGQKSSMMQKMRGKHGGKNGKHVDMKKLDDAIIAGDYAAFKVLASTTPLANISQGVFTSLQAPTIARKQAQESIQSILTSAGVTLGRGSSTMMNR